MKKRSIVRAGRLAAAMALVVAAQAGGGEPFLVPLENPEFADGPAGGGAPAGWSRYGGASPERRLSIVDGPGGRKALLIADGDPAAEIGVAQRIGLKGGETYQVTAKVCALGRQFARRRLSAVPLSAFAAICSNGTGRQFLRRLLRGLGQGRRAAGYHARGHLPVHAPRTDSESPGHRRSPDRRSSSAASSAASAGRPPQYAGSRICACPSAWSERASRTWRSWRPAGRLSGRGRGDPAGDREPHRRQGADRPRRRPGSRRAPPRQSHRAGQPLDQQDDAGALRPLLLPGGSEVPGAGRLRRSGRSTTRSATAQRRDRRRERRPGRRRGRREAGQPPVARPRPKPGELSIGWTMETKLGRACSPPTDIEEFETWEASKGYGSVGYFGWCSISKRMAMYYMTGDAVQRPRGRPPVLSRSAGDCRTSRRSTASGSRTSTIRWPGSTTTTPTWRSCSGT